MQVIKKAARLFVPPRSTMRPETQLPPPPLLSAAVRGVYGVRTQILACKLAIGPQTLEAN